MNETVQMWLFGSVFGLIGAAIAIIGNHVLFCNKSQVNNAASFARIESMLEEIKSELGTHETGIRGQLHKHSGDLLKLDGRTSILEHKTK